MKKQIQDTHVYDPKYDDLPDADQETADPFMDKGLKRYYVYHHELMEGNLTEHFCVTKRDVWTPENRKKLEESLDKVKIKGLEEHISLLQKKRKELEDLLKESADKKNEMKAAYEKEILSLTGELKAMRERLRKLELSLMYYEGAKLKEAEGQLLKTFQRTVPNAVFVCDEKLSPSVQKLVMRELLKVLHKSLDRVPDGCRRKEVIETTLLYMDYLEKQGFPKGAYLFVPEEASYYEGEMRQIIMDVFYECSDDNTLVAELLEENDFDFAEQLRMEAFSMDYRKAKNKAALRSVMLAYGFTETTDTGHLKFYYYDPRYSVTGSGSPSDHRTAINTVSDITRLCM